MTKHQIEKICWMEVNWQRPFELESVWNALTHLSALSPRSAIIWECRGKNGQITHMLGADQMCIGKVEETLRTHGDIQFREVSGENRTSVKVVRQLKITRPILSLNTEITEAVIRAGLAAMAADKTGAEMVLQVVLGRGLSPSPVPADLSDPHATWLEVILGSVSKATTEARKTVREKAEQHGFEAAIRIGVSDERAVSRLRSLLSALKVLESAGVRIHDDAEKPEKINGAHVPWHFPLRLSVKELANFLLLPAGDAELPGVTGLHPRSILPPVWYREFTNRQNNRSFAVSMDMVPKRISISPRDSLEHCVLLGPTGSGKSTAMLHLILADIVAGRSVLVLDPKKDLVTDILARIPEERAVTNDKFTMRVFLIRLGFIGSEYQTARALLLRNLTGNSSWLAGPPPERRRPRRKRLSAPPSLTLPLTKGCSLLGGLTYWLTTHGTILSDENRSDEYAGVRTITVCWQNQNYNIIQVDGITCKIEQV